MPFEWIKQALDKRAQDNLLRSRRPVWRDRQSRLHFGGDSYLDFSSNDYLGMSQHPQVIRAAQDALERYGVGSGGSAMVTGYNVELQKLESYLADWLGFDRCILFGSGFAANTGVLETLMADKQGLLIQDKLNHASLIDGGLHCQAKSVRFKHNDIQSLEARLKMAGSAKMVVSEGIFSMDGDGAPLEDFSRLCKDYNSALMVDDAHGFGVLGEQGKGSVAKAGLTNNDVDIYMATFGKAVGTSGAFVCASDDVCEYLLQFCRHYTYSTAMPSALVAATFASLEALKDEQWRRDKLSENITYFKQRQCELGLGDSGSSSAIQPILIGDSAKALSIGDSLRNQGIWLGAIRPPTVPKGSARLRVTLSCLHSDKDIDHLFNQLEPLL